jgi:3-methyladenine DNA glycosylase AlkD
MEKSCNIIEEIKDYLLKNQDLQYKKFHSSLMPTINSEVVIGIKVPILRNYTKELLKKYTIQSFIPFFEDLPHQYYEENNIHAFLIEKINNYDECLFQLEQFLPYIDNWATCDMLNPKVFSKNKDKLLNKIHDWIKSSHTYTIRFGIGMLMRYFLDKDFNSSYLELVYSIKSEEYYVNMMKAWFFATALAKQYDATLPVFQNKKLDIWTHNKAIQKAIESFRVPAEHKQYLKTLKIKN